MTSENKEISEELPVNPKDMLEKAKKMSDQEIENKATDVLIPESNETDATFLGVEFKMKPLSIKWTRRISKLVQPIMIQVQKTAQRAADIEEGKAKITDLDEINPLDEKSIDGLLDAVYIMLEAYEKSNDISREILEERATVTSVYEFAVVQVAINGENDFLLQPLRMLLGIVSTAAGAVNQAVATMEMGAKQMAKI